MPDTTTPDPFAMWRDWLSNSERQWNSFLNQAMSTALREWNTRLEEQVNKRTKQLVESQSLTLKFYEELKKNFDSTLEVLSIAIDQRDHLTSSHSFRVTQYALEIGKIVGVNADDEVRIGCHGIQATRWVCAAIKNSRQALIE